MCEPSTMLFGHHSATIRAFFRHGQGLAMEIRAVEALADAV